MTTPSPYDDNRSVYVIVYMAFTVYGFLVGLGVGWFVWG